MLLKTLDLFPLLLPHIAKSHPGSTLVFIDSETGKISNSYLMLRTIIWIKRLRITVVSTCQRPGRAPVPDPLSSHTRPIASLAQFVMLTLKINLKLDASPLLLQTTPIMTKSQTSSLPWLTMNSSRTSQDVFCSPHSPNDGVFRS
jgi:hypothetical protein